MGHIFKNNKLLEKSTHKLVKNAFSYKNKGVRVKIVCIVIQNNGN